jgi:hypothetical protein
MDPTHAAFYWRKCRRIAVDAPDLRGRREGGMAWKERGREYHNVLISPTPHPFTVKMYIIEVTQNELYYNRDIHYTADTT